MFNLKLFIGKDESAEYSKLMRYHLSIKLSYNRELAASRCRTTSAKCTSTTKKWVGRVGDSVRWRTKAGPDSDLSPTPNSQLLGHGELGKQWVNQLRSRENSSDLSPTPSLLDSRHGQFGIQWAKQLRSRDMLLDLWPTLNSEFQRGAGEGEETLREE